MLASISDKHRVSLLKIVPNPQTYETANHERSVVDLCDLYINHSVAGLPDQMNNLLFFQRESLVIMNNQLFLSRIFPIIFIYLKKSCYTKVMKVIYRDDRFIYKVVLSSLVNPGSRICWLQLNGQGWTTLLGKDIDERLIQAITLAIDSQEYHKLFS